jgi:hypothetical protein
MKRVASAALWPRLRTLQIYGANTGVGKTIFSTVLCRAFQRKLQRVQYVKPVSTGPLDEADDRYASFINSRRMQDESVPEVKRYAKGWPDTIHNVVTFPSSPKVYRPRLYINSTTLSVHTLLLADHR